MSSSRLRLVTLDITNTLIRVAGSPGYQYALVARRNGVRVDEKVLTKIFLKHYKEHLNRYPNFGAEDMMPSHIWWSLLVKNCFRHADKRINEATLDKIATDLYFHYTTPLAWEFLPGALDAVKDLRQYPVKMGVISNWDHRLYKVLMVMKLRPYFDFVLPSTVVGVAKPDKLIFHQALQDGNCRPEDAVHFGDNVEKDFIGAKNVGMDAYLLASETIQNGYLDQKFVVKTVQEFVDVIRPRLGEKVEEEKTDSVKPL